MKKSATLILSLVILLVTGCASTRSISNSGPVETFVPPHRNKDSGGTEHAFRYQGELNEFDVLGVERARSVTDEEIARAFEQARQVNLKPGSSVLVVQSGAVFPDAAMIKELGANYRVTAFSGIPPRHRTATDAEPAERESYARSLRLAAARAGAETIICYWGILESARRDLETKTLSWVPIAGWMLPDEAQQMRLRLKLALIDVRSGAWTVVIPETPEDKAISTRFTRGSSDQKQVEELKRKAYAASARELAKLMQSGI